MANKEHEQILRRGARAWNTWRAQYPDIQPDLGEVELKGARLRNINLSDTILRGANLARVLLSKANLARADLSGTHLRAAYFRQADLNGATLQHANLKYAMMVATNLDQADISNCHVYGVAAWDVVGTPRLQTNLIITRKAENPITVDNLEAAQFIYLLLHNEKIRQVIDTITAKAVLILGRFTPERKAVLDAIREEVRRRNYLPIVFDFEKPARRDLTETIFTLAHMARFVIADLTDAKSIPQELERIVPDLPSVPVQPILQASAEEYSMFEHFTRYPWVLETYRYEGLEEVIASLTEKIIAPAELKANELVRQMRR